MMGSRTTNQVSQYKLKYFKQHPELKNPRGTEQTDSEGDSCDPHLPLLSALGMKKHQGQYYTCPLSTEKTTHKGKRTA